MDRGCAAGGDIKATDIILEWLERQILDYVWLSYRARQERQEFNLFGGDYNTPTVPHQNI